RHLVLGREFVREALCCKYATAAKMQQEPGDGRPAAPPLRFGSSVVASLSGAPVAPPARSSASSFLTFSSRPHRASHEDLPALR
ncbi:MAG: hypothetical protein ABIW79_11145, partial [Gemmatimonas sp.]